MIGSVDEEGAMDVISLDLNRAFDMVSHSCGMLLGKWERDGVAGQTTQGVAARCVATNRLFSSGIAQSPLLQPVLFNIFINKQKGRMDYNWNNGDR